jgi:hypothetical protein
LIGPPSTGCSGRQPDSKAKDELPEAAVLFYDKDKLLRLPEFAVKEGKFGEKPLELALAPHPLD